MTSECVYSIAYIVRLIDLVGTLSDYRKEVAMKYCNFKYLELSIAEAQGPEMLYRIITEGIIDPYKLVKKGSPRGADHVAMRLYYTVLESILLPASYKKSTHSDELQASIESRQLFFKAFLNSSNHEQFNRLTDKAIEIAEEFQCYTVLIDIYSWRRHRAVSRKNRKAGKPWLEKQRRCEKEAQAERDMLYHFENHWDEVAINTGATQKTPHYLLGVMPDLEHIVASTSSNKVMYYYYLLQMELALYNRDFEECETIGLDLVGLIESSRSLKSDPRLLTAYSDIADNFMLAGKFKRAIYYCNIAEKYTKNISSVTRVILPFTKAFCSFYDYDFDAVRLELDKIRNITTEQFDKDKCMFFEAYMLHLEQQYTESLATLSEITELKADGDGWQMGVKLLEIQNYIMLGNTVSDSKIKSLEKQYDRHKKVWNKRWKHIITNMLALRRNGYQPDTEYKSTEATPKWRPKTPELIPFEDWFMKMKQTA